MAAGVVFNYLYLNQSSVAVGAVTPYYPISAFERQECDCYQQLTLSCTFSGNTALSNITLRVDWYSYDGSFLFQSIIGPVSTASGTLQEILFVQGASCNISVVGSTSATFIITNLTAILVVF
jgi:hypothetical protein